MKRIKSNDGVVHFVNPAHAGHTLCCRTAGAYLLGQSKPLGMETSDPVNCPNCAKVVCAIRNEPYNTLIQSVIPSVLRRGIYAAADPDGQVREMMSDGEEENNG